MTECDVTPWAHLLGEGTSLSESGKRVSVRPFPGERIRMFLADTPAFRAHFGNQQSCDAIFLVEAAGKRKLFFIELKGRNFEDSIPQLAETFLAVQRMLPADCRNSTTLEAIAVSSGGTPTDDARRAVEAFRRRTKRPLLRTSLQRNQTFDLRSFI